MVAAWIRADTGVGPSIASGSQTCSGNWADLPIAPVNTPTASQVRMMSEMAPVTAISWISGMSSVPVCVHTRRMPDRKPRSPRRVTTNALVAAALAVGRSNQKPMSRYEQRPTISQKTNSITRLSDSTSPSMAAVNRDIEA